MSNPNLPITMSINELSNTISEYVKLGFSMAVKLYMPESDVVRKKDLKSWLRSIGYDSSVIGLLKSHNLITPHKMSDAKNSPLYYSKSELLNGINNLTMMRLIAKNEALYSIIPRENK